MAFSETGVNPARSANITVASASFILPTVGSAALGVNFTMLSITAGEW